MGAYRGKDLKGRTQQWTGQHSNKRERTWSPNSWWHLIQLPTCEMWVTSYEWHPHKGSTGEEKWQQFSCNLLWFSGEMMLLLSGHLYQCKPHHRSACGWMTPHTNVVVRFPEISPFQSPTMRSKNKISAHWQICSLNTLESCRMFSCFELSCHGPTSLQTHWHTYPNTSYIPEWVIYLVAIRTAAAITEFSSLRILLRSTLNADFMKGLTSTGRLGSGKRLNYNQIKTQEALSST